MSTRLSMVAVLLLAVASLSRADPPADEQILRGAGVPIDPSGLLKFLRSFAPTEVDPASVQTLIRQLGSEEFREREAAVKGLIALGPRALPFLRQALKDNDRERAIRAEHCLKVIDAGPGPNVHGAALRLVAHHKPAGAAAALLDYLPFAPNDRLADEAALALTAVAAVDGKADPAVAGALTDKLPLKRAAAAEALCKLEGQLPAVSKLLGDADATVRLRVALALIPLKVKESVPTLIELLDKLPAAQVPAIEGILYRLAGDTAPSPSTKEQWTAWWRDHGVKIDLAKLSDKAVLLGLTVIAQAQTGIAKEIDAAGKLRWQIEGLQYPMSIQMVAQDRVLVAEYRGRKVTERNTKGEVLWEVAAALPISAQRLSNGNTFIASRARLFEVDKKGATVFSHNMTGQLVMAAKKLPNGQVVCLLTGGVLVRLDATGKEMHRFPTGFGANFGLNFDVTAEGRIFIPQATRNKVVEYSAQGKVEKEHDAESPDSVQRLPNGNLLVGSQRTGKIIELDARGRPVWEHHAGQVVGPLRAVRR